MNQPIRVLCVFSTLDRGGAESMCMNLYRHIDHSKVQFDFVKHTNQKGAFEDEIIAMGGKIFSAPRYQIYNQMAYENWWRNHLQNHPEHQIIHGHFFTISAVYFKVCKRFDRITVAHSHCMDSPKGLKKNRLKHFLEIQLQNKISKYSDCYLACSRQAGIDVFGDHQAFRVLNNAIEASKFRSDPETAKTVREEFSLGNSLVLGNVSRFNLQKNPHGTLEIFRLVHEKRPDSKLLWVGDGPMRAEVQAKVAEYGIQDDVIFTGVRSDVNKLLQGMDAFLMPSFYEGLPVAAVEAQAAGLQSLISENVTREVGVTELCHFLPLDDLTAWADAIVQLPAGKEHPDMYDQIVKAGYDIHETAKWIQEFYLSLSEKEN
ncbi:MAG: glycosyltransferase [Clostridia bacterium]|nr:glycosyltransferase [Clostridia bacterium]